VNATLMAVARLGIDHGKKRHYGKCCKDICGKPEHGCSPSWSSHAPKRGAD
jgi:hypothetical protein